MPFTIHMPSKSPTMEEGTVVKWHKKEGDRVERDELLLEILTDKAVVEVLSMKEGYLQKILVQEKGKVDVNEPIAIFTKEEGESIKGYEPERVSGAKTHKKEETEIVVEKKTAKKEVKGGTMELPVFVPEPPLEDIPQLPTQGGRVKASPLAKKVAKEKGLDISSVKGSGPGGRVTSGDLDLAQKAPSFWSRETPAFPGGYFEDEDRSAMRQIIGTRLQQSKSSIPHFYVRQEIDAEPLNLAREQLKNMGVKVSVNDFIVRASAKALVEHPYVNSGFRSDTNKIIRFKTIDIAIAVSIDDGLITPIVRHANYKNLGEISAEVRELANRAKVQKLEPHEYKGGSFTISNLGMYGVSDFVAVINPPQAAILAVAGIEECVRFKNGVAVPGKKMNLTLSADHRVVDGADAAKFLHTLKLLLENPASLLI